MDVDKVARGLGWLSLKIGTSEVVDPGGIGRRVGVLGKAGLLRGYGVREIGTGLAILNSRDPEPWIWARVAGDVVDVATVLPAALNHRNPKRRNAVLLVGALLALTAVDVACATALRQRKRSRF